MSSQIFHDDLGSFSHIHLVRLDVDLRLLGRLVRRRDASELYKRVSAKYEYSCARFLEWFVRGRIHTFDFPGAGLLVEALGVALLYHI